jgi:glycosyltransferase involved in cell wall biosynthesis
MPAAANGGRPEQKPYFLFVGRLEKIKGLQTVIPLFNQYEKAQLWIAGDGAYGGHLRQLAARSQNIRFLGRKSRDELRVLYRNATALLVPSLSFEVFSLVIIEAFMQRTPAIVRNIGGMPEIIQESGGGYIYETDQQLVGAMEALLGDSSHRNLLGARGYEAFTKKWTADAYLASYFGLIRKIAAARDAPSAKLSLPARPA